MAVVPEQTIWNDLIAEGASAIQAAGIMGNMQNESAFDPEAVGDSGTSFGLVQQHGSYSYLVTGNTQSDLARQLANIKSDIGLASGSTAAEAGGNFASKFEICVGCQPGGAQYSQRSANATAIYNAAQSGNWPQGGTGAAATGGTGGTGSTSCGITDITCWVNQGVTSALSQLNPITWIENAFGSTFKNIMMRLGLILLGGIVIFVGIMALTHSSPGKSSNDDLADALKQAFAKDNKSGDESSPQIAGSTGKPASGKTGRNVATGSKAAKGAVGTEAVAVAPEAAVVAV